jgi:predicted phage baseplate assembly protein
LGQPKIREGISADSTQWLWHPQRDLLESQGRDQHFVVETDNDGRAHLRFGNGELGSTPEACMILTARYRVGNGPAGNVGADTITTVLFRKTSLSGPTLRPRNPLPARGGTAPEPMAEAKLFAPGAFRKEQRAVIADDYARQAEHNVKVQHAGASLRWTGSWYAAHVAVDALGSEPADEPLLDDIKRSLYRYRRMGHDLEVRQARYVPLEIELQVCVLPHYLRGHVEAALRDVFSNRALPDGGLGFFHPDNLTFGEGIYLSKLVAVAQAVPGVESVQVTCLQRLGEGDRGERKEGILRLGPLEVAQLDHDPSFPEHGTLKLNMGGGR